MERAAMAKCEITVRGNLGADVESKVSKAGKMYYVLRVGSTPSKKNAAGEWENGETMWFTVTAFEEMNPFEYVKGVPVEIHGTFTSRTYTKRDGTLGFALDVLANKVELVVRESKKVVFEEDRRPLDIPKTWSEVDSELPF
jgi:single-strand DNA-binding protein